MKKYKQYRYIGRNGIITSRVRLDGINFIPMTHIESEPGYILTNGEIKTTAITVEDDDLHLWYEIVDNTQKQN